MGSQHLYAEPRSSIGQRNGWAFFRRSQGTGIVVGLSSDEHFSIDDTLLDAWASHKSFMRKDGDSNPPDNNTHNPTRDFKGEKQSKCYP
jgi:hypothetical protein